MEEHSAAALRCAEDIIRAKSNWKGPAGLIRVNFAVASGPAIYGAVGDDNRLEYTVIGSAVNRSAKLEKLNKSTGSTGVCDQMTFDLAVRQGYIPSDEPVAQTVRVDGEPETIDVILFGMHR